jgi:hypothetical protein
MHALIDELGRLEAKLAPTLAAIKPKVARVKWLKEQIGKEAGAGEQVLHGFEFGVSVSPNALERTIVSMPRLFRTIGQGLFLSSCSFPLGTFDTMVKNGTLSPVDKAVLLLEEHTGTRPVKSFKLPILET